MEFKRSGRKIFGVRLTSEERRALDEEIRHRLAEWNRKDAMEIDAIILWQLHTKLGFGKKRLKEFFDSFRPEARALLDRYEMSEEDQIWLRTRELKSIGVDLEEWYKEAGL